MKRFKDFIEEEKIFTKEDEGAAPIGDISPAPTTTTTPGEFTNDHNGSVSTGDIIGHCDHNKDHHGFFHKGCLHLPYPIFAYPASRIKKRKRKYIKVLDLTESDDFNSFSSKANEIIKNQILLANEYLHKIDPELNAVYDADYDFSGNKSEWVAALNNEEQDNAKTFKIAFNLPVLYNFLDENSLENDVKELECQIKASLFHEIGHAIIKYCKDQEVYDFELSSDEEEKMVEEFAKYHMREYTKQNSSKLHNFISEIFDNINEKQELNEDITDPWQKAYIQARTNPKEFLSTKRTINLQKDAVTTEYPPEGSKLFDCKTDLFDDVNEPIKIIFKKKDHYIACQVVLTSSKQAYLFVPTTNDFVRLLNALNIKTIDKSFISTINKTVFGIFDAMETNIFQNAVDENYELNEGYEEVDKLIIRELTKIKNGTFEYGHQLSKIDRLKHLISSDNFDYGKIIYSKRDLAKAKESKYSYIFLTDKAVEFTFNEKMNFLRSFGFKDVYGLVRFFDNIDKVTKINTELLNKAFDNQSSGRSSEDNNTSKYQH